MAATFNIKRCINEVEEIDSFTYSGGTGKRYALDIETSQLARGIQAAPMTLTVEVTTYNFQNQSITQAKKNTAPSSTSASQISPCCTSVLSSTYRDS